MRTGRESRSGGEGKKYVGECMRLSGWGGGDVGVGVGGGEAKTTRTAPQRDQREEQYGSMFRGLGCFADSRRVTESRKRRRMLERDRIMKVSIVVFFFLS